MKRKVKEIEFTPEMLRELQLIQLECLIELDRICRKCNIEYSIDGGTLLGAARHKGFIPWDDDVDVIMSRAEYEKFFEACKAYLDDTRFFLQERRTDPHYRVGYTRIRRKNTVYIRAGQEAFAHNTGVLIDIFILDNMPQSKILRYAHRGVTYLFRKILWSATGRLVSKSILERIIYSLLYLIPARFAFWGFDRLAKKCNEKPTSLVRHYAMTYPNPKRNGFGTPADLLEEYAEIEFEGHKFKTVAEYDRYLKLLYGDYMELPPEKEQKPRIHLSSFKGVSE